MCTLCPGGQESRISCVLPTAPAVSRVANLLKAELKRHGVTYAQLTERLREIGVDDKEVNIRNKLSRGKFSAVFLVQCLKAIGAHSLRLD